MATYVRNKDLYNEMVRLKDASLNYSPLLHEYFSLMTDKFSTKFIYNRPEDRDDCKAQAMMDLYMYWHNFNPKYTNAFAYITQIIKMGYAKGWKSINPVPRSCYMSISQTNIFSL